MEQENTHNILIINGTLDESGIPQATVRINKTADKNAYMREYMKTYGKKYRVENPDKLKITDFRKYWRQKFRTIDLIFSNNEELDKLTSEDCNQIFNMVVAKRYFEEKPDLMKYV